MSTTIQPTPTFFYDASAITKLFVDEPGADVARKIFNDAAQVYTSWVVIAEVLGALKRKWLRKEIDDDQYGKSVHLLLSYVAELRLKAVDVRNRNGQPALDTFELDILKIRKAHPELDAADALQFAAIQNTYLRTFASESKTQLVSADRNLLKAAAAEGIPAIDVSS